MSPMQANVWKFQVRDFQSFGRVERQQFLTSHVVSDGFDMDTSAVKLVYPQQSESSSLAEQLKRHSSANSMFTFLYESYHIVFALDISPSMFVPNSTPRKYGMLLFDQVRHTLQAMVSQLVQEVVVDPDGDSPDNNGYYPTIFVTILAESTGSTPTKMLLHRVCVDSYNISQVLSALKTKLQSAESEEASKYVNTDSSECGLFDSAHSDLPSDSDRASSSASHNQNVLVKLMESGLNIHFRNRDSACPLVVLMTDGVAELPPNESFDHLVMRYCKLGVACNIVEFGNHDISSCAFLHIADHEMLHYIAQTTGGTLLDSSLQSVQSMTPPTAVEVPHTLHRAILWQFTYVSSAHPAENSSKLVPREPRVTSPLQAIDETSIQHAFPWHGSPPPLPVLVNVVMEYRIGATLRSILSRRASEGFTVQEIHTDRGRDVLRIRLGLTWQPRVTINYIVCSQMHSNEATVKNKHLPNYIAESMLPVVVQMRVLAPHEFLRLYYRVASMTESDRARIAHTAPFQLHRFLNCLTEVDRVQAHVAHLTKCVALGSSLSEEKAQRQYEFSPDNPVRNNEGEIQLDNEYSLGRSNVAFSSIMTPAELATNLAENVNAFVLLAKAVRLWDRWFNTRHFSLWTGREPLSPGSSKHPILKELKQWSDASLDKTACGMSYLRFLRLSPKQQQGGKETVDCNCFAIAKVSWETAFVANIHIACHGMSSMVVTGMCAKLQSDLNKAVIDHASFLRQQRMQVSKGSHHKNLAPKSKRREIDRVLASTLDATWLLCNHLSSKNLSVLLAVTPVYAASFQAEQRRIEAETRHKLEKLPSEQSSNANASASKPTSGNHHKSSNAPPSTTSQGRGGSAWKFRGCCGGGMDSAELAKFHSSWSQTYWTPNVHFAREVTQLLVSKRISEGFVVVDEPFVAEHPSMKSGLISFHALSRATASSYSSTTFTYHLAKVVPVRERHQDGPVTALTMQYVVSLENDNSIRATLFVENGQVFLPVEYDAEIDGVLGHFHLICEAAQQYHHRVDCALVSAVVTYRGTMDVAMNPRGPGGNNKRKSGMLNEAINCTVANGDLDNITDWIAKVPSVEDHDSGKVDTGLVLGGKSLLPFAQRETVRFAAFSENTLENLAELYCSLHDSFVALSGSKLPYELQYTSGNFHGMFNAVGDDEEHEMRMSNADRLKQFLCNGAYFATALDSGTLLLAFLPPLQSQLDLMLASKTPGSRNFEVHFFELTRKMFRPSIDRSVGKIEQLLFRSHHNANYGVQQRKQAAGVAGKRLRAPKQGGLPSLKSDSGNPNVAFAPTTVSVVQNANETLTPSQQYHKEVVRAHQTNFARQVFNLLQTHHGNEKTQPVSNQDVRLALKFCERTKLTINTSKVMEMSLLSSENPPKFLQKSEFNNVLNLDFQNQVSKLFFPIHGTEVYCLNAAVAEDVLSEFHRNQDEVNQDDIEDVSDDDVDDVDTQSGYSSTNIYSRIGSQISIHDSSVRAMSEGSVQSNSDSDDDDDGDMEEIDMAWDAGGIDTNMRQLRDGTDGLQSQTRAIGYRKSGLFNRDALSSFAVDQNVLENNDDEYPPFIRQTYVRDPVFLRIEVVVRNAGVEALDNVQDGAHDSRVTEIVASRPLTHALSEVSKRLKSNTEVDDHIPSRSSREDDSVNVTNNNNNNELFSVRNENAGDGNTILQSSHWNYNTQEGYDGTQTVEILEEFSNTAHRAVLVLTLFVVKPTMSNTDLNQGRLYSFSSAAKEMKTIQPWIEDCRGFLRRQINSAFANALLVGILEFGECVPDTYRYAHMLMTLRRPEEYMLRETVELSFVCVDEELALQSLKDQLLREEYLKLLNDGNPVVGSATFFVALHPSEHSEDTIRRLPFWSTLTLHGVQAIVDIHAPPWMQQQQMKLCMGWVVEGLLKTVHRSNQSLLLRSLDQTRLASRLLIPPTDLNAEVQQLPRTSASSSSLSSIPSATKPASSSRNKPTIADQKLLRQFRRNPARRTEHATEQEPSTNHEQWTPWAQKQDPGTFACHCLQKLLFFVPAKEGPKTAIAQLRKEALHLFIVENRANVYVYKPDNGEVFYVQLRVANRDDFETNDVEFCNTPDGQSGGIEGVLHNTDVADEAKSKAIVLEVFGIHDTHRQFIHDVRMVFKNKLTSIRFDSLHAEVRIPGYQLTVQDVDFLVNDTHVVKSFPVPTEIDDPLKLLLLFQQSLLEVLIKANFTEEVIGQGMLGDPQTFSKPRSSSNEDNGDHETAVPGYNETQNANTYPMKLGGYIHRGKLHFVETQDGPCCVPALWPLFLQYQNWEEPPRAEVDVGRRAMQVSNDSSNENGSPVVVHRRGDRKESNICADAGKSHGNRSLVEIDANDMTFIYRSIIGDKPTAEKKRHVSSVERDVGKGIALSSISLYARERGDTKEELRCVPITKFLVKDPPLHNGDRLNQIPVIGPGYDADLEVVVVLCGRFANLENLMKFHHMAFHQAVCDYLLERQLHHLSTSRSTGGLLLHRVLRSPPSAEVASRELQSFESLEFNDVHVPSWAASSVRNEIQSMVRDATSRFGRQISVQTASNNQRQQQSRPPAQGSGGDQSSDSDDELRSPIGGSYWGKPCKTLRLVEKSRFGFVPRDTDSDSSVHCKKQETVELVDEFPGQSHEFLFGEVVAPYYRIHLSPMSRRLCWDQYIDKELEIVHVSEKNTLIETGTFSQPQNTDPEEQHDSTAHFQRLQPPRNEHLLRGGISVNAHQVRDFGMHHATSATTPVTQEKEGGEPAEQNACEIHVARHQFLTVLVSPQTAVLWHYNWRPELIASLHSAIQGLFDWVRLRNETLQSVFFQKMELRRLRLLNSASPPISAQFGHPKYVSNLGHILENEVCTTATDIQNSMFNHSTEHRLRGIRASIDSSSSSLVSLNSTRKMTTSTYTKKSLVRHKLGGGNAAGAMQFRRSRARHPTARVNPLKDAEYDNFHFMGTQLKKHIESSMPLASVQPAALGPTVPNSENHAAEYSGGANKGPGSPKQPATSVSEQKYGRGRNDAEQSSTSPSVPLGAAMRRGFPGGPGSSKSELSAHLSRRRANIRRSILGGTGRSSKPGAHELGKQESNHGLESVPAEHRGTISREATSKQNGDVLGRLRANDEVQPTPSKRFGNEEVTGNGMEGAPATEESDVRQPKKTLSFVNTVAQLPIRELHLAGMVPVEQIQNSKWGMVHDPVRRQIAHFNACALEWTKGLRRQNALNSVTNKWVQAVDPLSIEKESVMTAEEVNFVLNASRVFHCGRAKTLLDWFGNSTVLKYEATNAYYHQSTVLRDDGFSFSEVNLSNDLLDYVVSRLTSLHAVHRVNINKPNSTRTFANSANGNLGGGVDDTVYLCRRLEEYLLVLELRIHRGFLQCNIYLTDVERTSGGGIMSKSLLQRNVGTVRRFDVMGPVHYGSGTMNARSSFPDVSKLATRLNLNVHVYDFHIRVLCQMLQHEYNRLQLEMLQRPAEIKPEASIENMMLGIQTGKRTEHSDIGAANHDSGRDERQSFTEVIQTVFNLCKRHTPAYSANHTVCFEVCLNVDDAHHITDIRQLISFIVSRASAEPTCFVWGNVQEAENGTNSVKHSAWFIGTSPSGFFDKVEQLPLDKSRDSTGTRSPAIAIGSIRSSLFEPERAVVNIQCCLLFRLQGIAVDFQSSVEAEKLGQAMANIHRQLQNTFEQAIRSYKVIPLWHAACGDTAVTKGSFGPSLPFTNKDLRELNEVACTHSLVHVYPAFQDILSLGVNWESFVSYLKAPYKDHHVQVDGVADFLISPRNKRYAIAIHISLSSAVPKFTVYSKFNPPYSRADLEFIREFLQQVHFWLWQEGEDTRSLGW